jgi:hypothetical protein
MAERAAAAAVGVVFGFTLAWAGMSDPDVIRQALLVESPYLYVMFAAALATAAVGLRLVRRFRMRALVTREPISWVTLRPERRHVVGSVLFGLGWSISAACPGPIAAQAGGGVLWSLATLAGVFGGVKLYLVRQRALEPAPEAAAAPATAS